MAQTLGWSGTVDDERRRTAASGSWCPARWVNLNPRRRVRLGWVRVKSGQVRLVGQLKFKIFCSLQIYLISIQILNFE
jgi:hypothetical protein